MAPQNWVTSMRIRLGCQFTATEQICGACGDKYWINAATTPPLAPELNPPGDTISPETPSHDPLPKLTLPRNVRRKDWSHHAPPSGQLTFLPRPLIPPSRLLLMS
eukprot:3812657-Heterocapsa_arctica.AAC.1